MCGQKRKHICFIVLFHADCFFSHAPAVFFRKRPFEAVSQEDIKVLFGGSDVRVEGLAGIVRVRVGSLVTYYVYESSHKDRNAGVCVSCVCAVPTSITQHVFRNEPAFWPRAPASGLYLTLHADLHEKNKNPSLFFSSFFRVWLREKAAFFPSIFGHKEQHQSALAV